MTSQTTGFSPRLKKWILLGSGAGVLGLGLLAFNWNQTKSREVSPRRSPIIEAVYGLGTVLASRTFVQRTGITTEVRKFYVKAGDDVKKGAALVQLGEQGTVHAPFDGTVTLVAFKEGEIVFPQIPILKLEDLSERYVQVSLEQQGALRVRKGLKASLVFESLRGKKFEGTVRSVFPSEGQFLTDIQVDHLPPEILPGMTTDVAIEIARKENALTIPVSSIAAGRVIVVHPNGQKEKIPVEIGVVDGAWAEVISPALAPEDKVIVKGNDP